MFHMFEYLAKLDDSHPIECYLRKYKEDYPNHDYDFIMVVDLEMLIKDFIRSENEALPDFDGYSSYEWFDILVSEASNIPWQPEDFSDEDNKMVVDLNGKTTTKWEDNNNEWERDVESYRAKFYPLEKSYGVIGDVNNDFPWGY